MQAFWTDYWWLIFPLGFLLIAIIDRWLAYRRSRDALEVIKAYAAQGKEPPAEVLRAMGVSAPVSMAPAPGEDVEAGAYRAMARRRRRHYVRHSEWRTAIYSAALALAFWLASEFADVGAAEAFRLTALILAAIAAASALVALVVTRLDRR